ncbi:hypothetical protein ES319_D12G111300v1 [Gossypium barbadense]|uniref:Uncharacterized protein n=1 Tax=Gossypium barbadense TaxID=3634 RepID=A0A5J5NX95_GOSBA|nr:hypothetical protein ES319_D12G111300v1 [Gossypium barbadense]
MGMNDPTHPVHRTICGESGVWARVGLFMASLKIEARGERKRNWTIRISLDPAATENHHLSHQHPPQFAYETDVSSPLAFPNQRHEI